MLHLSGAHGAHGALRHCTALSGLALLLLLTACSSQRSSTPHKTPTSGVNYAGHTMNTSFYGHPFHGRKTASGERFNMHQLTAAHKTLRFGTRLHLTNPKNGKSTVVRITDRGPFIKGRDLDVSKRAAQELDFIRSGVTLLQVEYLDPEPGSPAARYAAQQQNTAVASASPTDHAPHSAPSSASVRSGSAAVDETPVPQEVRSASAVSRAEPVENANSLALATSGSDTVAQERMNQAVQRDAAEDRSAVPATEDSRPVETSDASVTIQVASFNNRSGAEELRDALASEFPAVYIAEALVRGARYHRVRVGRYSNPAEAENVCATLQEKGFASKVMPLTD